MMQYRINPKNGDRLPALGFGGLRLPKTDDGKIDQAAVEQLVECAFSRGITHFDTAYSYEGSEVALGSAIAKLGIRDQVTLSTKLPLSYCKSPSDFDRFLEESLARLQTDSIDYFFLHALNRKERFDELEQWGLLNWLAEKKRDGVVKSVGFSSHASYKEYAKIVQAYDWDFTMIQYNYLDVNWQAGSAGVELAASLGIPMFIMEPLRGGLLVNHLPHGAREIFDAMPQKRSYAAWGLRYVLDRPNVLMALSGMNALSQIEENCRIAEEALPNVLTPAERAAYVAAAEEIHSIMDVYCTSCGYCMPCPRGVSIPACMNRLNASRLVGIQQAKTEFALYDANGRISNCVACGICKLKCPQGIDIPKKIALLRARFEI